MTSQQQADAYLTAWRLLRAKGIPPEQRLPMIDALAEMERAKLPSMRHCVTFDNSDRT